MKKTLLIALLVLPFLGFSQTTKPVEGFLGIKFGTSQADVIAAIKARGGVLDTTSADYVGFEKVNLGQRTASWFFVKFFNNQAFEACFIFSPEVDDKAIDYYNDLNSDIAGIYGTGKPFRIFKSPYKDGDGYEITAIQEGDADYSTEWISDKNYIKSAISLKLKIHVFYVDGVLQDQYIAAQKAKQSSDY